MQGDEEGRALAARLSTEGQAVLTREERRARQRSLDALGVPPFLAVARVRQCRTLASSICSPPAFFSGADETVSLLKPSFIRLQQLSVVREREKGHSHLSFSTSSNMPNTLGTSIWEPSPFAVPASIAPVLQCRLGVPLFPAVAQAPFA